MEKITRRTFLKRAASRGALIALAPVYPVFIERYIIQTNYYQLRVPNLPAVFSGLRVVQISDLHYGSLMPLALIEDVIDRVNRIERDIVVCAGDYVHGGFDKTAQIDAVWPVVSRLTAPLGVYSVLGNHDHWANTSRSLEWLRRSGQDLRHKAVPVERGGKRIWLAGAGDLWGDHIGLDHILKGIPETDCRIVLAHNPDTADSQYSARVDLFISGHTHGGQVNIPFLGPPVLPVDNKTYSSGLTSSRNGTSVFISRGIGWAVVPVRFNCFPEIAALELIPA
jgi:uncharacterized protein